MAHLRINKFGKRATCPATETLLRYASEGLAAKQHENIAAHIATCDFCGAAIHLLSMNPPPCIIQFPRAEMPAHLQTLVTEFLTSRRKK